MSKQKAEEQAKAQQKTEEEAKDAEQKTEEAKQAEQQTETDSKRSGLCRGSGHAFCNKCYHTERYGRHVRCQRACAVIDGSWGPAFCTSDCERERVT